ncbi:MAG: sugar transferase, partial [Rhodoblastus sp.]|nr:sugar transferase [Rhodoblastus sp.]
MHHGLHACSRGAPPLPRPRQSAASFLGPAAEQRGRHLKLPAAGGFDERLRRRAETPCDIALSLVALIALAPLFALVAIAIKLESPGPVLYFQSRHGFNRKQFRIVKFRSMRATEEGAAVKQATADDPRVTRVGR